MVGNEGYVAARCPCCNTVNVDTRHARVCLRAGERVNQHQSFLHAISRTLSQVGTPHKSNVGKRVRRIGTA